MMRLEAAAIYIGLNIIILLILAYLVSAARRRHKIALGDGGNEAMHRAIRAHANAAEFIPAGLAGLLALALLEPAAPLWLLHASGISLTGGRIAHGIGLSMGTLNAGRMVGTLLSWIAYLLIGGGLLYAGLSGRL